MSIAVIVATYGSEEWRRRGRDTADHIWNTQRETPDVLACVHGDTLAAARNQGAADVDADWLIFCDADDDLDYGYVAAMAEHVELLEADWLVQPATLGVYPDGHEDAFAVLIPRKPLIDGNFMVIGTMVRRQQFLRVGGFDEWPCFEDWSTWLRCYLDGAMLTACPEAIYRVGVNSDGRNSAARDEQVRVYNAIRSRHLAHWNQRTA